MILTPTKPGESNAAVEGVCTHGDPNSFGVSIAMNRSAERVIALVAIR
jgi:hypothetical protein